MACTDCPVFGGCWPMCLFPPATWASNNTADESPPQWALDWEIERKRRIEAEKYTGN